MFHKQVSKEIETLFADSEDISDNVFTYDQISGLPEPVQRYFNGHGNMLIKIFSTFTIADAKGSEMDYSSLIRFLSEAPWYPTALLPSEYLQWEEIDKVRIPHEVEVVWRLKTDDFSYARFRVTEIEFNNPSGY